MALSGGVPNRDILQVMPFCDNIQNTFLKRTYSLNQFEKYNSHLGNSNLNLNGVIILFNHTKKHLTFKIYNTKSELMKCFL